MTLRLIHNDCLAFLPPGPAMQRCRIPLFILSVCFGTLLYTPACAQEQDVDQDSPPGTVDPEQTAASEAPNAVSVEEVVEDEDIETRLTRILAATGWFTDPEVRVDEGVVFLTGTVDESEHSEWASRLARNTEDVVAVVNRLQVTVPPFWNVAPAMDVLRELSRTAIQSIPLLVIAAAILLLTWLATRLTVWLADVTILQGIETKLLREVSRKAIAVPVILIGLYLVLIVSGLSRLAMTVLGGTGLFGLVLGVAFRDILENFLASILISVQNPFRYGDLIEVEGHVGYVQRVNTRGTLLMTFDGNHIQIPNSTVYKNIIKNFTANPNIRFDFVVGVGYDATIASAQEIALRVLRDHPAVLDDPEPLALVEELGSSTINLRVYLWVNAHEHSGDKVRSSVIRQVMRQLESAGISMPDDAREVVFPDSVPVQMLEKSRLAPTGDPIDQRTTADSQVSTASEGEFETEARDIHSQARQARDPDDENADLLDRNDPPHEATSAGG